LSYQVFSISGSPRAWRVLLALTVKQVPFENCVLSVSESQHKSPEFTAVNPRQRVPVLKDGDFVLTESVAIPCLSRSEASRAAFDRQ
jgi:glutathione S-transferase